MSTLALVPAHLVQPSVFSHPEAPPKGTWSREQPLCKQESRNPSGTLEDSRWQKLGGEAPSVSALRGLDDSYVIEDRSIVADFIKEQRLRGLLLEALAPLARAFGEMSIKKLRIVVDDEGFTTLFCVVMVSGEMQEARRSLRAFDQQWWLARSEQAIGKLNFDFDLI